MDGDTAKVGPVTALHSDRSLTCYLVTLCGHLPSFSRPGWLWTLVFNRRSLYSLDDYKFEEAYDRTGTLSGGGRDGGEAYDGERREGREEKAGCEVVDMDANEPGSHFRNRQCDLTMR
jgi:hypothetical protein